MLSKDRAIGRPHYRTVEHVVQVRSEFGIEFCVREHRSTDDHLPARIALAIDMAFACIECRELVLNALLTPEKQRPPRGEAGGRRGGGTASTG